MARGSSLLGPTSRNCPNGCGLDFMLRRTARFGYLRYRENSGTRVSVEVGYVRYRKIWGPITRFRRPGSETRSKRTDLWQPFGLPGSGVPSALRAASPTPDPSTLREKIRREAGKEKKSQSDRATAPVFQSLCPAKVGELCYPRKYPWRGGEASGASKAKPALFKAIPSWKWRVRSR